MAAPPQPPGQALEVHAASVLVVAPHYDDEVLGCGGLLAQLVAAGSVVRVLFLSDSSGGDEGASDPQEYARRRKGEAEAVGEQMGWAGIDHLGLPDGRLSQHLDEIGQGLRRALLSQRPELLLVPSPLEVTDDHRAAFAACHRVLGVSRGDRALDEVLQRLGLLIYEINQPAYPDVLVDVSPQLPLLEEAMALYASQQERHDYLAAGLGLRRFRTLSLGPEVAGAEGYRRLAVEDLRTRSPAQLVAHLGGRPELLEVREGPRISVVVRTFNRPELLAEALESLAAGTYRRAEVVLVNDGGRPPTVPESFPLPVRRVDLERNQGRSAAANAGVAAATGDYVGFLDDDDLVAPEHLAALARAVEAAGVRVVYSDAAVGVYELDGEAGWGCRERRLPYSRDFDPDLLLFDNYIPFHTLLIPRELFAEAGSFDPELPFFEDWDFLLRLAAITPFHHLAEVTCEYRHFRGAGHHVLGDRPRERSDFLEMKARVVARHRERGTPEAIVRTVDRLRSELVAAEERWRARSREAEELGQEVGRLSWKVERGRWDAAQEAARLRQETADAEERYHRMHGAWKSLEEDHARVSADLQRLYSEEAKLREVVEDQTDHLGRTYGEIERLQGVIRAMEQTWAWRLYQRFGRKRSPAAEAEGS